MLYGNNIIGLACKPRLNLWGIKIANTEKQLPTCFFCLPQLVPANSLKRNRGQIIVVPRLHSKHKI
jgi:hypothetical protein